MSRLVHPSLIIFFFLIHSIKTIYEIHVNKYDNYKEVNGVKFPHTMTQSFGSQEIEIEMSEVKINEGVSDADFQ